MENSVTTIGKKGNKDRIGKFAIIVATAAVAILAITSVRFPAGAAGSDYGGVVRIAGELDAMGFDALKARSSAGAGRGAANLVMEKLFERGKQGELIPVLGLSAKPSDDGKIWTVKLRKGVAFHDGVPFNADAVVRHWNRILKPENRYRSRILIEPVVSVEKTGEYEVRFHLKHGWPPFTSALTNPAGFTALIPSPKAVEEGSQNSAPVGTGPFVFKEWKRGDRVRVVKNPDYWRKGKPYLDEIVFLPIPDHESRYAALISGQADMLITDRPSHIEKLNGDPDFDKYLLEFRGATVLALNNSKPPLDDVRVRRALAMAWDQKKYILASFRNTVPFAKNWMGDAIDCEDSGYPYPDLNKARALISEYGKPVELEYIHTASKRGREAGLIVRQLFERVGVKVEPIPSDFPGIMKQLFGGKYDMTSWVLPGASDMGAMSTAILHSKSPWNVYRYSNREVDDFLIAQSKSADPEFRQKTLCEIVRKVNADSPFLYLFGRTYRLYAKKSIRGIKLPVSGEEGFSVSEAWIQRQ